MGKPRTGSVLARGDLWRASVPRLDDPRKRLETTFAMEADAWAWVRDQLERLAQGVAPVLPVRATVATTGDVEVTQTSFAAVGWAWYRERYEELERAGADRASDVHRNLEGHLVSAFADLFECDLKTGRQRIVDWLRAMSGRKPLTKDSPYVPDAKGYAQSTVTGMLWIVREIIAHAGSVGIDVPDFMAGKTIVALEPVKRVKRKAVLVTLGETARLASHLHVVYQFVLWMLRLTGMRISEVYGVIVKNFFVDEDGDGFILARDQGGKAFGERGDDGTTTTVHHKEDGKTDASYRLIALPRPLTTMIKVIIATYHTDADGHIDVNARLVPTIRSAEGGQDGFRSALTTAAQEFLVFSDDEELEMMVVCHDLRKSYATDLAWNPEISGLLARRILGHRAGSDVFDLVYTLDTRLKKYLAPVARALEASLHDAAIATLMVATARRPLYGTTQEPEAIGVINRRLEAAGWQVDADDASINVAQVAALLGLTEKAVRRLIGDAIPGVKTSTGWRVDIDDVLAYRDRFEGKWLLREVASDIGVSYQEVYRMLTFLEVTPARDSYDDRVLVLSSGQAEQVVEEFARIAALEQRAVKRGRAAEMLGVTASTVGHLFDRGQLVADPKTDASGAMYFTLDSIGRELSKRQRRGRRPRPRGNSKESV